MRRRKRIIRLEKIIKRQHNNVMSSVMYRQSASIPVFQTGEILQRGLDWITNTEDAAVWRGFLEKGVRIDIRPGEARSTGFQDALWLLHFRSDHSFEDLLFPGYSAVDKHAIRQRLLAAAIATGRGNHQWHDYSLYSILVNLIDPPKKAEDSYGISEYFLHTIGTDWRYVHARLVEHLDAKLLPALFFLKPQSLAYKEPA